MVRLRRVIFFVVVLGIKFDVLVELMLWMLPFRLIWKYQ